MTCLCVYYGERKQGEEEKKGERESHCYCDPLGHGGGRFTIREWALLMETRAD